ncbi:MAG: hypothetical protein LBH46_00200 [Rickettsiales bacterium]|jgi:hypothetical protein|nr:hypothetical protein [Rickettsiales bacterium]
MENKKRFSDFAKPYHRFEGDKVKIDNLLDKEIEILNFEITNSKFADDKNSKCLTIQFRDSDNQIKICFSGSSILMDQLEKHQEQIPFFTIIIKKGRCYSFS